MPTPFYYGSTAIIQAAATNLINPLDARRADNVGRKLLVAKHRQSFLQRELEPIAASHAITGPVVKVLVSDDTGNIFQVSVRGALRIPNQIPADTQNKTT